MRNADGELVSMTVMELMRAHERKEAVAQSLIGKTYYDSITEVMNEDINKLKSFDKVEFILMKSGMLSLIWAYLKLSLLKNRRLLKHKRKDELKLCYKFINKLYKLR
jgi:hypothetical protein